MFVPLAEQLANVRRWNRERGWGFADAELALLDLTARRQPRALVVDVLAVYLPGDRTAGAVRRTCHELWTIAAERQPQAWSWDERMVPPKPVRLLEGAEHRPGVRRVTVDLAAHFNPRRATRSLDVRGPDSAHAEVLAAAAHFPEWIRSMDGREVPYVGLSGYQVTHPDYETWRRLPCLSWSHFYRRMNLTAHWADLSQDRFAFPVLVPVHESVAAAWTN